MALGRAGSLVFVSGGPRLAAINLRERGEPFVYDCTRSESQEESSADTGNNGIVAFAFSPSGSYVAVTADNKQLLLFRTRPWECLSVRSALRRSTSLTITGAEDQILLADKSGDVYSFSISEPHDPGQLRLGHLSMLLAVTVSPDGRYVITADRDEKIRVSLLEQPYIIQAFCLGHREFVSELSIPLNHPHLLVSGSGDGTVRLWEYENGKQLHCLELSELQPCETPKTRCAVIRLVHCKGADFFAVSCDGFSAVYIVELDVKSGRLIYRHTLTMKQRVWDMAFDDSGGLWVLTGDMAVLYQLQEGAWQEIPDHPDHIRIKDIIRANWPVFQGSTTGISYNNLYKMSVDNMAEYQLKKQQRIDQRLKKRKLEALELGGDSKRLLLEKAVL